jgi:soluble lytic murein transglycosylase
MKRLSGSVVSFSLIAFAACATGGGGHGDLALSVEPRVAKAPMSVSDQLAALDKWAPVGSESGEVLVDVRLMLRARAAEEQDRQAEATKLWFEALGVSKGKFGQEALQGWIRSYAKNLGKTVDPDVLTRLLLAETRQGQHSPYMMTAALSKPETLRSVVLRVAKEWLEVPAAEDTAALMPPASAEAPSRDPLLQKLAADWCAAARVDEAAWTRWRGALQKPLALYWMGMTEACRGNDEVALKAYQAAVEVSVKEPRWAFLALAAQGKVVAALRERGDRQGAADAYLPLVRLWESRGVTPESMAISAIDLDVRRMEEILWAARYRAMIGDDESAKLFAQRVADLASAFQMSHPVFSKALREQIAEFRADAFHTIAFRASVERGEWDAALALTITALQTPDLSTEWKERLQWHAGLYEFMAGRFEDARRRWEEILQRTKDDGARARTYFWVARALRSLKRRDEAKHYQELLAEEYPLSYYTVVAGAVAGKKDAVALWHGEGFPERSELEALLRSRSFAGVDRFDRSTEVWTLIRRAEVLASLRMDQYGKMAATELEVAIRRVDGGIGANPDLFVYLSRLHYAVGNSPETIRLTTEIARAVPGFWQQWPEQLLVYFPRPFMASYRRQAEANHLRVENLLAISRQESSFASAARSPVGALGLMQLMPRTAVSLVTSLPEGISVIPEEVSERLLEPEVNIAMGATYLKALELRYKGLSPAAYAAYNAGEFAVDGWLARRPGEDLLAWIELMPFGETRDYVKNVWRNALVYSYLSGGEGAKVDQPRPKVARR